VATGWQTQQIGRAAGRLVAICRSVLVYHALMGSDRVSDQVLRKKNLREHLQESAELSAL